MSLVSTRLSLTHRCSIERNEEVDDQYGNPGAAAWVDHLTDLPCRAWDRAARGAVDATTIAVVEDRRMMVPLGTDVLDSDRVGDVTYRGDLILKGPMLINALLTYPDRLELVLTRIS
jgi:hypothetical protein